MYVIVTDINWFLERIDNNKVTLKYIRFRAHALDDVEFCQTFRMTFRRGFT
nr:MAG TPA: hypothetical protein [Bacteriophage sp.]